jgi:hypothetical protein
MRQLNVAQLIELLKAQPQDALMYVEGCDCWGKAVEVRWTQDRYEGNDNMVVVIEREN